MQAYTLKHEIIGAYFQEETHNSYTGYAPLTQENLDDINDFFVRQQLSVQACDIFISIDTPLSECSVELPVIVNKMLKYIDCKLTLAVKNS